jgi:hypothetical protein
MADRIMSFLSTCAYASRFPIHSVRIQELEVTPLGRYSRGRLAREGLQLGFAAVDKAEIERGVRELATALEMESKALKRRGHRSA